jgi:DNA-directed RNA polymerase specialized sigma24 family protein
LRDHEDAEGVNSPAWNAILQALVNSIADGIAEETGQQLLLLAFMPAIHKTYAEVRQLFPDLGADDIAQQALLVFLEALRLPVVTNRDVYLSAALAKEFRRRLFRWAFSETRRAVPSEEISSLRPEPASDEDFEDAVLLEDLLSRSRRAGVLSQDQCDLLRKFKCEGFEASELAGMNTGTTTNAVQMRLKRIFKKLRRELVA